MSEMFHEPLLLRKMQKVNCRNRHVGSIPITRSIFLQHSTGYFTTQERITGTGGFTCRVPTQGFFRICPSWIKRALSLS
jgi:hypothetical protein